MLASPKRVLGVTLTAILCVALLSLPQPSATAKDDMPFVFMDEPLPPYSLGKEGEICTQGLTKEIFDILFDRMNASYEIRLVPWARAIHCAKNGSCDGIPMLMKNKERESFMVFTDPVMENVEMIYFAPRFQPNFKWKTLDDLKGFTLGLVRGYTYSKSFMNFIKKNDIQVTYAKDSKSNVQMLAAGHVDIILEDKVIAAAILASNREWQKAIKPAPAPVSHYTWHIGIARNSRLAAKLPAINSALATMRADGSLDKILSKR